MASWFVGQEVALIASHRAVLKAAWWLFRHGGGWPRLVWRNRIYVVSAVELRGGEPFLELDDCRPWRYRASFFRPVVKFKNDISVFIAILDRVNRGEVVDA